MLLALLVFSSTSIVNTSGAEGLSAHGAKGLWYWDGMVAATDFRHGLSLKVLFVPGSGCDDALFMLTGNDQITRMRFTIDGQGYNSVAVEREYLDGTPVVGFVLSDAAVYDLKNGYRLTIDTNAGRLDAELSGSAKAFNHAYGNCMRMIEPPMLQATPPRQAPPQASAGAGVTKLMTRSRSWRPTMARRC
jgi:hypothetical protein